MNKCGYCKTDLEKVNSPFILEEFTSIGYDKSKFCDDKCFLSYLLKKFGKKLLRIEKENIKCLLCVKKATLHSLSGNHSPPYVPLCKQHHLDIENIKIAIKIMNKEKKVSIKRFRQIIDSFDLEGK